MKFGDTFMEYLHGEHEWFLDKCSLVEYKRLKKVLKSCRSCKDCCNNEQDHEESHIIPKHYAFCGGAYSEFSGHFSCDLNATRPAMSLMLPSSILIQCTCLNLICY
ncbi:hypothetical protein CFOL_v3_34594 [Cephalotus follicularis]|uniref:Uncharacterized protein n=1 Tax=Cephalotus follicularis TaxID=3775 RepID=A0A1Q3DFJ4_CEPFO|nr:hypothetical protein CFOL_v3_34594 [Cephalotus follicularis]